MSSIMRLTVATLALSAGMGVPAMAADLYEVPVIEYVPEAKPVFGGWYLRGHIGMSNQRFKGLDYDYFNVPNYTQTWLDRGGFDSAPIFGGGIGYQHNDWLRGDVTVEYRGKSDFAALDRFTFDPDGSLAGTNDYTAKKSEWLALVNAYVDLGKFAGISPYLGAGIGASRNTISHFNDLNAFSGGGGFAPSASTWQLAWALHAGVGYAVNDRVTLDLGYSYVNLGDAKTGPAENYDPAWTRPNDGFRFNDLSSHDLKFGVRYKFN